MAKPSLALIPSGYANNKVFSVLPSNGDGDFDFSRSGDATRINKDGLIETVSNNVPRLNYPLIDGVVSGCPSLLLEPTRSNLVTYSEEVSNWSIISSGIVITDNTTDVLSPSGKNDASKVEFNAASKILGQSFTLSGNYSGFIYVKGTQGETIRFNFAGTEENFTLTGGWDKLERTNITATANAFNLNTFTGVTARTIYVYAAQLEQGSYPTSYIPTNGQSGGVTRSAETCNGAGTSDTFNDSEGVLMAEISALANDGANKQMSLNNTTGNNTLRIIYNANNIRAFVQVSSSTVVDITYALSNAKDALRVLLKYKVNDYALWVNGFEVGTDTNAPIFSANTLNQFSFDDSSSSNFYGKTKQIQYFDTALTDEDLEELTSWNSFRDMAIAQQYTII